MNRLLILLSLLLAMTAVHAEMYRWVDAEGNVHFSDTPPPDGSEAERMDIPQPSSVIEAPRPRPGADRPADAQAAEEATVRYRALAIASPADDQTVRDNAGNVTVSVEMRPALQPTHRLRLYLDGELLDNGGTRTSVNLTNVPRGTHSLRAEIVDADGQVLRRTSSTFHLQRVAVGQAPPFEGQRPSYPPPTNLPSYPPQPNFPTPPSQIPGPASN